MTDGTALRSLIQRSGLKYKFIAEKVGLTANGLMRKINNQSEFKASEIQTLCELLNIPNSDRERIFFAQRVEELSTKEV